MLIRIFFIFGLFCSLLFAQVSQFFPQKPIVNDTVKIIYNPFADSAKYSINDDVYVVQQTLKQNGDFHTSNKQMKLEDSVFTCEHFIENNTASIQLYFIAITNNAFDYESNLTIRIYAESKPVMNSFNGDYETELKNYPDNYAAYRTKWFWIRHNNPDTYKNIITNDLKDLNNVKDTTIGLLYSKSYGYLLINEIGNSYSIIESMVKRFPKKSYTANAIDFFALEILLNNNKSEYYQRTKNLLNNFANNVISSENIRSLVENKSTLFFSDTTIFLVCRDWISAQSDNPVPYGLLAFILLKQNKNKEDIKEAAKFCQRAIDLTLKGGYRLYHNFSGTQVSAYLASQYFVLAKTQYLQNNFSKALPSIKAAIALSNEAVYIMNDLEGDIWYALKKYDSAEKSYITAWKLGSKDAKKNILNCYKMNNNDTDGFEKYFSSLTKDKQVTNDGTEYEKAKLFSVIALNGKKLSLQNLIGKVIVVNFWFTGCTPCKLEIPQLNKLVKKYKNKKVTFIAFALDEDEALLKKYLKLIPFSYQIVMASTKIAKNYKISGYPTHFIINQKGEIIAKIVGGSNDIGERISIILDRIL